MTSLVPSVPDMPRSRVPDFFMVGHPKSGSTALFRMLRAHPQIFMPARKEPWFFAPACRRGVRATPGGRPGAHLRRSGRSTWRYSRTPHPEQRIGEGFRPPTSWSPFAAQRLAEPCSRVRGWSRSSVSPPASCARYTLPVGSGTTPRPSRNLLPGDRPRGRATSRSLGFPPGPGYWTLTTQYSEHVRYVEQLRRYEEYFPTEQLHVIVYDDFRADNRATGQELLRFLGVDPAVAVEVPEANPSVQIRFHRLHELIHAVANTRAVRASAKALAPYGFSQERAVELRNRALYRKAPALDTRQLDELRKRYKHEVEALSEHLDRDLVALWGYDQV